MVEKEVVMSRIPRIYEWLESAFFVIAPVAVTGGLLDLILDPRAVRPMWQFGPGGTFGMVLFLVWFAAFFPYVGYSLRQFYCRK